MRNVVEILRKEHVNMTRLLALLEHQIGLYKNANHADLELIRSIGEYFYAFPKECHHPKEDAIYRKLVERAPGVAEQMVDLEVEHENVQERLSSFVRTVDSVILDVEMKREHFAALAMHFVESERKHMIMEERYFFPLALDNLNNEDWDEIDAELSNADDPLFDAIVEERFRLLRRELVDWGAEAS